MGEQDIPKFNDLLIAFRAATLKGKSVVKKERSNASLCNL